jgi:hypothetical protein
MGAVADGARTRTAVAAATGLRPDVAGAALTHLARAGRLTGYNLTSACPASGCARCPLLSRGCG